MSGSGDGGAGTIWSDRGASCSSASSEARTSYAHSRWYRNLPPMSGGIKTMLRINIAIISGTYRRSFASWSWRPVSDSSSARYASVCFISVFRCAASAKNLCEATLDVSSRVIRAGALCMNGYSLISCAIRSYIGLDRSPSKRHQADAQSMYGIINSIFVSVSPPTFVLSHVHARKCTQLRD